MAQDEEMRMSIWTDFGFSESPYATSPIPPTPEGARLLVGRDLSCSVSPRVSPRLRSILR